MDGGTHRSDWARSFEERHPPKPRNRRRTVTTAAVFVALSVLFHVIGNRVGGPDHYVADWVRHLPIFVFIALLPAYRQAEERGHATRHQLLWMLPAFAAATLLASFLVNRFLVNS